MTLKNIAVKYSLFNKLLLILAFTMLAQYAAAIGGDSNFYKVSAEASPAGKGKVYARTDTEHGPWLFKDNISSRHYGNGSNATKNTKVYLYAQPEEGYVLDHWTSPDGNTFSPGTNYTVSSASTDVNTPTNNLFTAIFVDTYVSVFTSNSNLCSVTANPELNTPGTSVTLKATLKNGVSFLGWRKKGTSEILSQDSQYTVSATSVKTTYEAVFSYVGSQMTNFMRMQSKLEHDKYITLQQDEFSYTPIFLATGGYSNLASSDNTVANEAKAKALAAAIKFIKGGTYSITDKNYGGTRSFSLIGDFGLTTNIFDPGTIILRDGNNFFAQGTDLKYFTEGYNCHHQGDTGPGGMEKTHLHVDGQTASLTQSNGAYIFSMNPGMYGENLGDIYLINKEGQLDVVTTSGTDDSYCWNLKTIDNEVQYFAFNPTIECNEKYYTTLRTGFSYKVKNPSLVKVYEINEVSVSDELVVKRQFADGEVIPGDLSVVLESTSQNPSDNILIPWNLEYTKSNSVLYDKYGSRLHCYTGIASNYDQYDDCTEDGIGYFKVPYKGASTIYKLSNDPEKGVGFWTPVANNEVISGNEGYSYYPCALFPRVKTPVITPPSQSELVAGDNVQVTITCATSGATIWYSLNGGEWQQYNGEFNVTNDVAGNVTIKAKATKDCFLDSHETEVTTYTFNALTAPTLSPTSAEVNVGETITFSATNPNGGSSSLQYRIDDGAWTATSGSITLTSTEVKTGTVYVKVVNGSAESEAVSATYSFNSDYQNITLANLINQNPGDTKYSITDLTAVQVVPGLIICKDGNVDAPVADNGEIDYLNQSGFAKITEQSNWIALQLPEGNDNINDLRQRFNNKSLTNVKGELVNSNNPTFLLHELPEAGNATNVSLNTYVAASFGGTQESPVNDNTYFFVQPKPMELANIEWAQWDGTKFVTPVHDAEHPDWNQAELEGEFDFNGSYLSDQSDMTELKTGHIYEMTNALIEYKEDNFEKVYILGNINGNEFAPNVGMPMFTTDGKTYTAVVTVTNSGNGYGYFSFTRKLATQGGQAGWDEINNTNNYRFGANSSGNFVFNDGHLGQTLWLTTRNARAESFQITPNTYKLVVHGTNVATLQDMSLVVTRESRAYAPLRDGESPKSYVVYPTSIIRTSSENNGVITDVMQLGAQREVASVEYYNLAGMRSTQPWQGINIVVTRYTDGTTTTTKRIKR